MRVPETAKQYIASITRKGGEARAKQLSAKRRQAIARKAARARWAKAKKEHGDTKPTKFPTGRREA